MLPFWLDSAEAFGLEWGSRTVRQSEDRIYPTL